jgi:hypothetical protein
MFEFMAGPSGRLFGFGDNRDKAVEPKAKKPPKEPEERKRQFGTWYIFAAFLGVMHIGGVLSRMCPARRIERVLLSIASPLTRPSPNGRRVGIRIVTFEACSGFTHVTARRIAQPPTGDLCHEAPTHAVTRISRSSATGSIDNSPGGFLLH